MKAAMKTGEKRLNTTTSMGILDDLMNDWKLNYLQVPESSTNAPTNAPTNTLPTNAPTNPSQQGQGSKTTRYDPVRDAPMG